MSLAEIKRMQIGQVVDFVIAYNTRQQKAEQAAEKEKKFGKKRKGNQNDINAFFG